MRSAKPVNPTLQAAACNTLLMPHRFINENVFLTKLCQYGVVYKLLGIDAGSLTDETIAGYSHRLEMAFRMFDEDFRIYQYLIKHEGADISDDAEYSNPVVVDTIKRREEFLTSKAERLYTIELYIVILFEPEPIKRRLNTKKARRIAEAKVQQNAEYLFVRGGSFVRTIGDLLGINLLGKAGAFRFFRLLATLSPSAADADTLHYDNHIDHWMSGKTVSVSRDEIRLDYDHVHVLSLREAPRGTFPNMLAAFLKLEADFFLVSEFKREPNETAISAINSAENHFHHMQTFKNWASVIAVAFGKLLGEGNTAKDDIVPDAAATETVDRLKGLIRRIDDGEYMGQYSLTMVLKSSNPVKLQGSAADACKIIGEHEGSLVRETYNTLNAYRSIVPGGHQYNFRQMWMPSTNYINLAQVYAPHTGEKRNAHLRASHLITLETEYGTPYYFNLHRNDLLGVIEFGLMGAGKSFTNNLLLDQGQKYDPLTFILDIGGSYQFTARKHGGGHLKLSDHYKDFTFNPFAMQRDSNVNEFLSSFVHVLLETGSYIASPEECRLIDRAVEKAERLSDLDVPESVKAQLYNWTGDGRHAHLFDNLKDTFNMSSFQAIDFQGVKEKVLPPLFFYIFQRISEMIYNKANIGRFKQVFADEVVWKFLSLKVARSFFIEAGKTFRKHNAGLMLTTQSPLDLVRDDLLDALKEICPMWIFLSNPGGDKEFYRSKFGMNQRQIEQLFSLIPKKQILVITPEYTQKLNVNVDEYASWYYRNDHHSNAARNAAIEEFGFEEGMRKLAASA
jgi:type IV secretion system protein VirB4